MCLFHEPELLFEKRIYIMMESKFRASLNGTTLGLLAE